MKKLLVTMAFVVTFFAMSAASASAALANNTIKVGLYYGNTALFSANLENAVGAGYDFGYFDAGRVFQPVGKTEQITVSMTAAGDIYIDGNGIYYPTGSSGYTSYLGAWHVRLPGEYVDYWAAYDAAVPLDGWPAWIDGVYEARVGCYATAEEAGEAAAVLGGEVIRSSDTGVMVTVTRTNKVLFEFDGGGKTQLGVRPNGQGQASVTWFKAKKYPGAFEYVRTGGGNLSVLNVLPLEDYVKGVIPYEMSPSWPMAALEAQAICARTYACRGSRHMSSYGFDVCNTTDCQVYYGFGSGNSTPSQRTDAAVDNTRGMLLYYGGDMVQNAVYHAANGGATEDVANVWGSVRGYLVGKEDPYEGQTSLPASYKSWSVTYTAEELTNILAQKGHNIGTVKNVYVSKTSPVGNAIAVTFEGTNGTKVFTGESGKTVFYSSTYGKSIKSMRFAINGGNSGKPGTAVYLNDETQPTTKLEGYSVLTANGLVTLPAGSVAVISSEGTTSVMPGEGAISVPEGQFVITGSGSGHNLGMSQYGAKAMAELGYVYEDILQFYYPGMSFETVQWTYEPVSLDDTVANLLRTRGISGRAVQLPELGEGEKYARVKLSDAGSQLNMRAEPNTGSEIVSVLVNRSRLIVTESRDDGWSRVRTAVAEGLSASAASAW